MPIQINQVFGPIKMKNPHDRTPSKMANAISFHAVAGATDFLKGIGHLSFLLEWKKTSTLRTCFRGGICPVSRNLSHSAAVLFLLTLVPGSLIAVSHFWYQSVAGNNSFPDFPHLGNGSQAALVHHTCSPYRIIYVPEDLAIRKACVVPNPEEPHNHPILPPTKTPVAIKEIYRKCVKNSGIVGSSVRTVDNGEVYLFWNEYINLMESVL